MIQDTIDPCADLFASVDSALESASDGFSAKPKRTLAEIIAEKKAKAHRGFIEREEPIEASEASEAPIHPLDQLVEDTEGTEDPFYEDDPFGIEDEEAFIDSTEDMLEDTEETYND
jgi:hypothetical protein